jgi:hypothetical protein
MDGQGPKELDPEVRIAKRRAWIENIAQVYYMPEPWWPLGNLDPPPEYDIAKRSWEKLGQDWKVRRMRAFRSLWYDHPYERAR